MSSEENKTLIKSSIERAVNQGDLSAIDQEVDTGYRFHGPDGEELSGPEGLRQHFRQMKTAFPDLHMSLIDMVAERDMVLHRWMMTGTNTGPFLDQPPTGKTLRMPVWMLNRISGGKVVEGWEMYDTLVMIRQLGIAPPVPQHA